MRIEECINTVDSQKPNQYNTDDKVRWLSILDASIKNDIIDMYEQPVAEDEQKVIILEEGEEIPEEEEETGEFTGYTPENLSKELLVPFPYDELYVAYLKAKIDESNGEAVRYNNSAATFNALLLNFEKWYNKTHTPKRRGMNIFKGVRI